MRSLQRWGFDDHPLKKFRRELDSVFQRFFDEPIFPKTMWDSDKSFVPACNIKEEKGRYIMELEIPGVEADDINIDISGNVMTIQGERKLETITEDQDRNFHMIEHSYGSFYRSFTLPDNSDVDKISADYKNGILTVEIPKLKDKKSKRIKIGKK